MDKATPSASEAAAIALVSQEYQAWKDSTAFVTSKIAFNVRTLIETLRKNYYGIFDEPNDPGTGQKKIWIPLTESVVDSIVKNIDLDSKDVNIRAKRANAVGMASFVRSLVKNELDKIQFGEMLDEMERFLCVDGTVVWKTYIVNLEGKKRIRVKRVDLLNFYIDPTAPNVQEATVIERAAMTTEELKSMDGWDNVDDVAGGNVSRNDPNLTGNTGTGVSKGELVEVFERWGLMPRSLITGNDKDKEMVHGHIVVSGTNGSIARVHLIEENTEEDSDGNIIKPYEECWYMKGLNRWHGRGPAEKIMMLQIYLNTVMNIRITRARVSQLGIFKIRKNSGITPQMLGKLAANGVISVNDPSDIEQMVIQEASQASYQDEDNISSWAGRVTSAFESVTGEQLPSSTPATNAVIQNRMAQSQFVMVRKGVGMFLQRWLKRHYLPKLAKTVTKGDITRMAGEIDEIRNFDNLMANGMVKGKVDEMLAQGQVPSPDMVRAEKERVLARMQANGPDRYVEMMRSPDMSEFDIAIDITNEEIDKGVLVQNLMQAMTIAGTIPDSGVDIGAILGQVFDVMGLDSSSIKKKQPPLPSATPPQQPQGQAPQMPADSQQPSVPQGPAEANTLQKITTGANTL